MSYMSKEYIYIHTKKRKNIYIYIYMYVCMYVCIDEEKKLCNM